MKLAKQDSLKLGRDVKCPHCGNADLDTIRFAEDVVSTRRVRGFDESGSLVISGESDEDMEGATKQRFWCQKCYTDFPISDKLTIEWSV